MSRRNQFPRAARRGIGLLGLIVLLGSIGAGACIDLSSNLEGEPCTVPDDCWHTQECTQTPEEAMLDLPGMCEPKGHGCFPGGQLGCSCTPVDPSSDCLPALPLELQATYPTMVCDPGLLLCVVGSP